jgi:hypothetical protein
VGEEIERERRKEITSARRRPAEAGDFLTLGPEEYGREIRAAARGRTGSSADGISSPSPLRLGSRRAQRRPLLLGGQQRAGSLRRPRLGPRVLRGVQYWRRRCGASTSSSSRGAGDISDLAPVEDPFGGEDA